MTTSGGRGIRSVGVCLCIWLLLAAGGAPDLWAVTLRINQPRIEAAVTPGELLRGTIEVENLVEEPVEITIYLQDWRYVAPGDGTKEFAPASTLPQSCADWVSFFPQRLQLPPKGHEAVNYTIRVPDDARDAAYAVLFFETLLGEGPSEEGGVSVLYTARLGSLILLDIKGSAQRAATITDLTITPPDDHQPLQIRGQLTNTGNVAVGAVGEFHVVDAEGRIVARGTVPARYTHPGLSVPLDVTWVGSLASGTYRVVLTLDLGGDQVLVEERTFAIP